MIREVEIDKFRLFNEMDINLGKFNLIAGRNNSGKTSFLEALFLLVASHDPSHTIQIDRFRGASSFEPENSWGWLFNEGNTDEDIIINAVDGEYNSRKLKISLIRKRKGEVKPSTQQKDADEIGDISSGSGNFSDILKFEYEDDFGREFESSLDISGEELEINRKDMVFPESVFLTSRRTSGKNEVERFSKLEDRNEEGKVIDALKLIDDRVKKVRVSYSNGNPSLKVDMGFGRLMPISYMGEGISRLLSIILGIAMSDNGIVFIDEVENGLHHSVMEDVWDVISKVSEYYETQVLATTHSLECIHSAYKSFDKKGVDDFRLHRIDNNGKKTRVYTYNKEELISAINLDMEVR